MIITPSATFARPDNTTQYTAADLIANSATAGEVVPMEFGVSPVGGKGIIRRARLFKNDESTTTASFAIHLFTAPPTVANGDNGAFSPATVLNHIGVIPVDMSSGAVASATNLAKQSAETMIAFALPTLANRIYALLVAVGGYTPSAKEEFTVTLEIEGA